MKPLYICAVKTKKIENMKKINLTLLFIVIAISFTNCVSVVEVSDQWQSEKFKTLNNQKILVINKTNDKVAKERFEKDLAERLRKSGVDAVESFIAFPDMKQKERTETEMDEAVKIVKDAGFTGVVVTGIRNIETQSQSTTTGGYDKQINTGEGLGVTIYNYSYHYYGFGSFYGSVYNSNLGSIYVKPETTVNSYNVYTLETVTYNLTLDKESQMVGVLTVKVTDPSSYEEIAGKYTKMIAKQFKKVQ